MSGKWTEADLQALDMKFAEADIKPHARPLRAAIEILGGGFSISSMSSPEVDAITRAYRKLFPQTSTTWPGAGIGLVASGDNVRRLVLGVTFGDPGPIPLWKLQGFDDEKAWWTWCREDSLIAAQAALGYADLHDFAIGVDALGPTNAGAADLWHMAGSYPSDIANILPNTWSVDSVIQPVCLAVEVSLKAALRYLGTAEKDTWGHGLAALASDLAGLKPHRDDGLIADILKHFPAYVGSRYKSAGLTRLVVVRLAAAAQFVAASSVRRLSTIDLAWTMETDTWPGSRQPYF